MSRLGRLFIAIFFLFVCGCGVKFADAPINSPLPASWKVRIIHTDPTVAYKPCEVVGAILNEKEIQDPNTGQTIKIYQSVGRIWPDNFKCEIMTIKPDEVVKRYYKSRVDSQASVQGSFLQYVTAGFKMDQMAEVEAYDLYLY